MGSITSSKKYDLAVAYRIYPGVSKSPFIHKDDKLSLMRTGLRSFQSALGSVKARIFFLLDGCPDSYEKVILDLFENDHIDIIRLNKVGNLATFRMQIEILKSQQFSDLVFFMEDDYVFRPNTIHCLISLLQSRGSGHFATPYDHLDSYTSTMHLQGRYKIEFEFDHHWRTIGSSCLTFATTLKTLKETAVILDTYSKGNWDSSMWFALTKYYVMSPTNFFQALFGNRYNLKTILQSWRHCWQQLIFGKRYHLWQPIPSIATHMEETSLAPNIDWRETSKNFTD